MSAKGVDEREAAQPERARLSAAGVISPDGEYEILAITAGMGNGWEFGEDCLRASLGLWDGAECFVDHSWSGHSLRDLAGVCHSPAWDDAARGVSVKLRAVGPSAGLLQELARQLLDDAGQGGAPGASPRVGFSADVLFTARGKQVERILRVLSVDLVYNPARGGAFKRALNSIHGAGRLGSESYRLEGFDMLEEATNGTVEAQAVEDLRAVRAEMCACLLDTALAAAHLPAPAAELVRKQFAGKVFEAAALTGAIEDARKLVSDLTGGAVVAGPRIGSMVSSQDQIQAAVEDLFEVERSKGLENVKAARLSGIRELYMLLTGDTELHGGYYPSRMQLATTADFPGLVKNALNKIVVNQWNTLGRAGYEWWRRIATVEHFNSVQGITGTLVGTVGALPAVAEGGAYPELQIGDSPETAAFVKYGGYIPLSLELIDRDETRRLKAYPRELASAGLRNISALVAGIFTANSGAGPAMADGGNLFNATAVTTAGGHANLSTAALSAATWETASTAVYNQRLLIKNAAGQYGTGPRLAVNPRYLLAPRPLQLTAKQILYPNWQNAVNITSENMQQGQPGDVITVPEWTDANDWAAVVDPAVAPAIFVGERFGLMPEIFIAGSELNHAVFTNDEHRMKVRHFLAVWVNDFRPLHKANVV